MSALPMLVILVVTSSHIPYVYGANFSSYSECARSCIYKQSAVDLCETGDPYTTNICLCKDVASLKATAKCIGLDCGRGVLKQSAAIADRNCRRTSSPLAISREDYVAAGGGNEIDDENGRISDTATIAGIVLGSIFGGITLIVAALQLMATLRWIPEGWKPFSGVWPLRGRRRQWSRPSQQPMTESTELST